MEDEFYAITYAKIKSNGPDYDFMHPNGDVTWVEKDRYNILVRDERTLVIPPTHQVIISVGTSIVTSHDEFKEVWYDSIRATYEIILTDHQRQRMPASAFDMLIHNGGIYIVNRADDMIKIIRN